MPSQITSAPEIQFNQFVQFAERAMQNGDKKAIARQGDTLPVDADSEQTVRMISVASDDKVYAIRRSAASKTANDSVRDIFRQAVSDMFSGNIPESVKKAMNTKDFGHGKPLTARRIMDVKAAIDQEERAIAFQKRLIEKADRHIVHNVNKSNPEANERCLSPEQLRKAAMIMNKVAPGSCLNGSNAFDDLLACYIIRFLKDPNLAANAEQLLEGIAREVSRVRNFSDSTREADGLNDAFQTYYQDVFKEICHSDMDVDADGINAGFMSNAHRGGCDIAGEKFNNDCPATDIANALKRAVTKPQHRKVLSFLMSQKASDAVDTLLNRMPIPRPTNPSKGDVLHNAEGAEMFIGDSLSECRGTQDSYQLEVSPDGKRAKLRYYHKAGLFLNMADADPASKDKFVIPFTIEQSWTLDLSVDEPKLVEYNIAQTLLY